MYYSKRVITHYFRVMIFQTANYTVCVSDLQNIKAFNVTVQFLVATEKNITFSQLNAIYILL